MFHLTRTIIALLILIFFGSFNQVLAQDNGSTLIASAGNIVPVETPFYSPNHKYFLLFQADGNLVIYSADQSNRVIWAAASNGGAGAIFQTDGNLVIYRDMSNYSGVVWASNTGGSSNQVNVPQLRIWNDGRITVDGSSGLHFDTLWDRSVFGPTQYGIGAGPFLFPVCINSRSSSRSTTWIYAPDRYSAAQPYYDVNGFAGACTL